MHFGLRRANAALLATWCALSLSTRFVCASPAIPSWPESFDAGITLQFNKSDSSRHGGRAGDAWSDPWTGQVDFSLPLLAIRMDLMQLPFREGKHGKGEPARNPGAVAFSKRQVVWRFDTALGAPAKYSMTVENGQVVACTKTLLTAKLHVPQFTNYTYLGKTWVSLIPVEHWATNTSEANNGLAPAEPGSGRGADPRDNAKRVRRRAVGLHDPPSDHDDCGGGHDDGRWGDNDDDDCDLYDYYQTPQFLGVQPVPVGWRTPTEKMVFEAFTGAKQEQSKFALPHGVKCQAPTEGQLNSAGDRALDRALRMFERVFTKRL